MKFFVAHFGDDLSERNFGRPILPKILAGKWKFGKYEKSFDFNIAFTFQSNVKLKNIIHVVGQRTLGRMICCFCNIT